MIVEILLYDALESLARGSVMTRIGHAAHQTYLDGSPWAATLFPLLHRNGWIRPINSQYGEPVERFAISGAGRAVLERARVWYAGLPIWRRWAARAGLVL